MARLVLRLVNHSLLQHWHLVRCLALLAGIIPMIIVHETSGHAELERASPPPDGLLAAPPRQIELWMTERVAAGAGSPSVRVLNETGTAVPVTNVRIDHENPRHVLADVSEVSTGTYTVIWSVRSADDGHTLTGSFAFRVGTGRAPGAATVEGERPQAWAVVTRWLMFLGAVIAAAGFLFGRFIAHAESVSRRLLVLGGTAIALVATALEPVLQSLFPPSGAVRPSLADAMTSLPAAWWLRPAGLFVALVAGMSAWYSSRSRRVPAWLDFTGAGAAALAIGGLALTSHVAAREHWRGAAILSIVLHQLAVGLWAGGLVHLGLEASRPDTLRQASVSQPARRFSRLALPLALIGIGTGVANAGLLLPSISALWRSDYGRVLLVKAAVLVPVLALAAYHRLALRRAIDRAVSAFRTTIRMEAALAFAVILGGTVLALLAPPTVQTGLLRIVDLAAPVTLENGGDWIVRLQVQPAEPGTNEIAVLITTDDGIPIPPSDIALVRLDFISLDYGSEQRGVEAVPTPEGTFAVTGVKLSLTGWWEIDVLVRQLGVPDVVTPFFLMLPDPNVHGFNAPRQPAQSAEAEQAFQRGLAAITSLHSLRWTQRLSGGTGTVVTGAFMVRDGSNGEPPAFASTSRDFEALQIGDRRWQREPGGNWIETLPGTITPPAEWGQTYAGATGFHLGITQEINGELAQVVTFYVPGSERYVPAWYAWWIEQSSGQVLQEAMVSRLHYMIYDYSGFNEALPITAPTG
ncbi:MAG: hypothetical protein KatS3mg059_1522 [Thermomicrobiales bacterium]|nr:MAG: hypothetical protein KatS3mg059_1522 [Thermomicrobiales bacterium]